MIVQSSRGEPVVDARVVVQTRAPESSIYHQLTEPLVDRKTDEAGRIQAPLPVLDRYLLVVDHPSHGPWAREIRGTPPDTVTLEPGEELHGRILLEGEALDSGVREGKACAAWVLAWGGHEKAHEWLRCTTTAEDGTFVLEGLGSGPVLFGARARGYLPVRRRVEVESHEQAGFRAEADPPADHPAGNPAGDPAGDQDRDAAEERVDILTVSLEPGFLLRGKVLGGRQPLSDAEIVHAAQGIRVETEDDGRFEIAVAGFPAALEARSPDHRSRQVVVDELPEKELLITLEPAEKLVAWVGGSTGEPLGKADVYLTRQDGNENSYRKLRPELEEGALELRLPGPGHYGVRIGAPDHRPSPLAELSVSPGQTLDLGAITLSRGAGVRGIAVDRATGELLPGVTVEVLPHGTALLESLRQRRTSRKVTDRQGRFEVFGLEPGRYELRASHSHWAPRYLDFDLDSEEGRDLGALELGPGVELHGTVQSRSGQARPGLRIQVLDPEQGSLVPLAETTSDGDGRFGDLRLAPGRYRLTVQGDRLLLTQEIQIQEGQTDRELELVVEGVELRGVVVRRDQPVEGGFLRLESVLDPGSRRGKILMTADGRSLGRYGMSESQAFADVGSDGRFVVEDAPAGALAVTYHSVSGNTIRRQITVPNRDRHEVVLEVGGRRLEGWVVSSEDGTPVESARIRILDAAGRTVASTTTDPAGYFEILDLPDGQYALEAEAAEFSTTVHKPLVLDEDPEPLHIALEPGTGAHLEIRLSRTDGSPVGGVPITVLNESGRMVKALPTNSFGVLDVEGLSPGQYFVVWSDGLGGTGVSEALALRQDEPTVFQRTLPAGGSVQVTCAEAECASLPIDHVALFASNGLEIGAYVSGISPAMRFSADGQLALGRLSPDQYLLQIWTRGRSHSKTFRVDEALEVVALP